MNQTKCEVIEDLLPLYIDQATSSTSNKLIEEHLKQCPSCKQLLQTYKEEIFPSLEQKNKNLKQIQPLKKMKFLRRGLKISILIIISLIAFIYMIPFLQGYQSLTISKRNTLQVDDRYQTVAIENIEFDNFLIHVIKNDFTNQNHSFYEVRGYQKYRFNQYHRIYDSPLIMLKQNDATLQIFNGICYLIGHSDGDLTKINVNLLRYDDLEFTVKEGLFFIPFERPLDKIVQIDLINSDGHVYDTLHIGEQRLPKYDVYSIDAEGNIVFEQYRYDQGGNIIGSDIIPLEN